MWVQRVDPSWPFTYHEIARLQAATVSLYRVFLPLLCFIARPCHNLSASPKLVFACIPMLHMNVEAMIEGHGLLHFLQLQNLIKSTVNGFEVWQVGFWG